MVYENNKTMERQYIRCSQGPGNDLCSYHQKVADGLCGPDIDMRDYNRLVCVENHGTPIWTL